jgi:hypothetical protein
MEVTMESGKGPTKENHNAQPGGEQGQIYFMLE